MQLASRIILQTLLDPPSRRGLKNFFVPPQISLLHLPLKLSTRRVGFCIMLDKNSNFQSFCLILLKRYNSICFIRPQFWFPEGQALIQHTEEIKSLNSQKEKYNLLPITFGPPFSLSTANLTFTF